MRDLLWFLTIVLVVVGFLTYEAVQPDEYYEITEEAATTECKPLMDEEIFIGV